MKPFLVLSCLALAACGADNSATKKSNDQNVNISELQTLADEACSCRMSGVEETKCNREFDKATANLEKDGFGTSSFPMSGEGYCFPRLGDDCVGTDIFLVQGNDDDFVCTREQAAEIEELVAELETSGQGHEAVMQRASERIAEIHEEHRVAQAN